MQLNCPLHRIDFGKRGAAWRYPSADGFLRGSSQIRAALRCFSSRTRNEKPHRNPKNAHLCATRFQFGVCETCAAALASVARTGAFAVRGSYRAKTTNLNDRVPHGRFVPRAWEEPRTAKAAVRATPLCSPPMVKITPLLIQEGWRAERRGGYLLKPKKSSPNQHHPLPPPQLRRGAFSYS